jgi:hypothetical protein
MHCSVNMFLWNTHKNTVTMEMGLLSVGSTPRLYSEDPRLADCSSVE